MDKQKTILIGPLTNNIIFSDGLFDQIIDPHQIDDLVDTTNAILIVYGHPSDDYVKRCSKLKNKKILVVRGFGMYNGNVDYDRIVLPNKYISTFSGIKATDYFFDVDNTIFYNMNKERRLIGLYDNDNLLISEDDRIAYVVKRIDKKAMALLLNDIKYIRFDHKIDKYNGLDLFVQASACGVNCIAGFPVYISLNSSELRDGGVDAYKSHINKLVDELRVNKLRVCVVYDNIPNFMDGFFRALTLLENTYELYKINTRVDDLTIELSKREYDAVLLKTGFNSDMCKKTHDYYTKNKRPKIIGIFISSVDLIPEYLINFFDLYYYETYWYKNYAMLSDHNSFHAFGTDTITFHPLPIDRPKDIDYLMVGSIVYWKRPLGLLAKKGKRVAIGEGDHDNYDLRLSMEGVDVIRWLEPHQLIDYYSRAKVCYINSTWYGGGERCVLDCRAMGVDLELPIDNPKLMELYNSPLYDQVYYAKQIEIGITTIY